MSISWHFQTVADQPSTYQRQCIAFYPDTIPYDYSEHDYKLKYQQLAGKKYYYVNEYELRPAHVLRYAWEQVRGFFGFENHCQTARTTLSLEKFIYYGNAKGFNEVNTSAVALKSQQTMLLLYYREQS